MQIAYYCKNKITGLVVQNYANINPGQSPHEAIAEWNKIYGSSYYYSLTPLMEGKNTEMFIYNPLSGVFGDGEKLVTHYYKTGIKTGVTRYLDFIKPETHASAQAKILKWNNEYRDFIYTLLYPSVPTHYYRIHRLDGTVKKCDFATASLGQPSSFKEAADRVAMWTQRGQTYSYFLCDPTLNTSNFIFEEPALEMQSYDTWAGISQAKVVSIEDATKIVQGFEYVFPSSSKTRTITPANNKPVKQYHMRAKERYITYNFVTFAADKTEARKKIIDKINSEYGHNFAMHLSEKEVYEVGDDTLIIIENKDH